MAGPQGFAKRALAGLAVASSLVADALAGGAGAAHAEHVDKGSYPGHQYRAASQCRPGAPAERRTPGNARGRRGAYPQGRTRTTRVLC
jgi:hypothetical protein